MMDNDETLARLSVKTTSVAADARKQRLSTALRDNLKRRKAQARLKEAAATPAKDAEKVQRG